MLQRLQLNNFNRTAEQFLIGNGEHVREDLYELDPPYQRASVWTPEQRVSLIKSLFMGLPIGAVVLNNRGYNVEKIYAVVDGKQRIETLRSFSTDGFAVPAGWFAPKNVLDSFTDTDGVAKVRLSGLKEVIRRKFGNFAIATLEAQVNTVAEEAEIFMLINSGGTAHTEETLTNADGISKS